MDVTIRFVPPGDEDVAALNIYEAPAADGPWVLIERTTEVGLYPDYIDRYTTANAVSRTDWFAIAWEDSTGALSPMSVGVQGGTQTVVGEVVDKVLQRDRSLDEGVVRQEAEAVIEEFVGDPYITDASTVSYRTMLGLVYLTMARCYVFGNFQVESSVQLGLVRMQQGTSANKDIDSLIDLANRYLGISTSRVLQTEYVRRRYCEHEVFGS